MCRLLLPLLFMLLMPFGALSGNPASPASILSSFRDRDEAQRMLGGLPLHDIEGIWEYPADEAAVAILRDERAKGRYLILWVEGVDCRLYPGRELGWIESSPDTGKFRISLSSALSPGGVPGQFKEGLASLTDDGGTLLIEMPRLKLSFNPSIVFPTFWNKLRLNLRVKYSDPLDRLPEGWIKTFPADSALPRNPVYL